MKLDYDQKIVDFCDQDRDIRDIRGIKYHHYLDYYTEELYDQLGLVTLEDFLKYDFCKLTVHKEWTEAKGQRAIRRRKVILGKIDNLLTVLQKNSQMRPYDIEEFSSLNYPLTLIPNQNISFKYSNLHPKPQKINKLSKKGIKTFKDLIEINFFALEKFNLGDRILIMEWRNRIIERKGFGEKNLEKILLTIFGNITIEEKYIDVLINRINGKNTLEQSAQEANVSKERIRQLEEKILKELAPLKTIIFKELKKVRVNRNRPLNLNNLEIEYSFFRGISSFVRSKESPLLKEIFDRIRDKNGKKKSIKQNELPALIESGALEDEVWFNCLPDDHPTESPYRYEVIEDDIFLYPKDDLSFKELCDGAKDDLDYEKYFKIFRRPYLVPYYLRFLKKKEPKSVSGKLRKIIPKILEEQDSHIAISELQKILRDKYDLDAASNQISNSFESIKGVYQFGRGSYGLESICGKFNESQITALSEVLVEIIERSSTNNESESLYIDEDVLQDIRREWGLGRYPKLDDSFGIYGEISQINIYDLNYVLKRTNHKYPELNDLGRRYWSTKKKKKANLASIVISVLNESGKPLSTKEIKKAVDKIRPVANFQLRPSKSNKELIAYSPNLWGLRYRDLLITEDQEKKIVELIIKRFKSGKMILKKKDLLEIMSKVDLHHVVTDFQVSRLLLTYISSNTAMTKNSLWDLRFKRDNSEYFIISPDYKGPIPKF